jgi:hypothetical protein
MDGCLSLDSPPRLMEGGVGSRRESAHSGISSKPGLIKCVWEREAGMVLLTQGHCIH